MLKSSVTMSTLSQPAISLAIITAGVRNTRKGNSFSLSTRGHPWSLVLSQGYHWSLILPGGGGGTLDRTGGSLLGLGYLPAGQATKAAVTQEDFLVFTHCKCDPVYWPAWWEIAGVLFTYLLDERSLVYCLHTCLMSDHWCTRRCGLRSGRPEGVKLMMRTGYCTRSYTLSWYLKNALILKSSSAGAEQEPYVNDLLLMVYSHCTGSRQVQGTGLVQ